MFDNRRDALLSNVKVSRLMTHMSEGRHDAEAARTRLFERVSKGRRDAGCGLRFRTPAVVLQLEDSRADSRDRGARGQKSPVSP